MRMQDNRGTYLEVGQTVCYNYSGEIAIGVVEGIKHEGIGQWGRWQNVTITIDRLIPAPGSRYSNPVSKVKNPANVMVIFETETPRLVNQPESNKNTFVGD